MGHSECTTLHILTHLFAPKKLKLFRHTIGQIIIGTLYIRSMKSFLLFWLLSELRQMEENKGPFQKHFNSCPTLEQQIEIVFSKQ